MHGGDIQIMQKLLTSIPWQQTFVLGPVHCNLDLPILILILPYKFYAKHA